MKWDPNLEVEGFFLDFPDIVETKNGKKFKARLFKAQSESSIHESAYTRCQMWLTIDSKNAEGLAENDLIYVDSKGYVIGPNQNL